jgi:hypothetical protein
MSQTSTPSNWHSVKDSQRRRYKEKVRLVIDEARAKPCFFCGIADPVVNQFHHINPEEKSFDVGHSWSSRGLNAVLTEIAKCVVVCANDHLRIHAGILEVPENATQ